MANLRIISGGKEIRMAVSKNKAPELDRPPAEGIGQADYIWLTDNHLNVKRKSVPVYRGGNERDYALGVPDLQPWTFERRGADGPDLIHYLSPCHYLPDPTRNQPSYIALCEVRNHLGEPIGSRPGLRDTLVQVGNREDTDPYDSRWGFEIGCTLNGAGGGLAAHQVFEKAYNVCLDAGIMLHSSVRTDTYRSTFKIGERHFPEDLDPDPASALVVADHVILARYLLDKVAREQGFSMHSYVSAAYVSSLQMRLDADVVTADAVRWFSEARPDWIVEPKLAANGTTPYVKIVPTHQEREVYDLASDILLLLRDIPEKG